MWDALTGVPLVELRGHTGAVTSVSFCPRWQADRTGSYDRSAKVWDAQTGMLLVDLKAHTDVVDQRRV